MAHVIQTWSTENHLKLKALQWCTPMDQDVAAYLGWRTGLYCHRGWPGMSPLLSETAETEKQANSQ